MAEDLIGLIRDLTAIPAPSGSEDELETFVKEQLTGQKCDIIRDNMGNLIVVAAQNPNVYKRIVLVAHLDEIFAVVEKINQNGFLHVHQAPGISLRDMYGRSVLVKSFSAWVPGKIVAIPNHLTAPGKDRTVPRQLFVDIGCTSKNEVEHVGIYPGAPIVFAREFFISHQKIFATALDDRAGVAILLSMINNVNLLEYATIVFSVKEEYLLRGSITALNIIEPDIIICVDASLAFDTPYLLDSGSDVRLGAGPVFSVYTFHGKGAAIGTVQNARIVRALVALAKERNIPLQLSVARGIVTEAAYGQFVGKGAKVIELGFPLRYAHSGVEACDMNDLNMLIELLTILVVEGRIDSII